MTITKLVERLRGSVPRKYPGFRNLNTDAASMLETLWAECEAGRKMLAINTETGRAYWCDFFHDGHLAYKDARRATDAAVGKME